jgi:hypothetical protein
MPMKCTFNNREFNHGEGKEKTERKKNGTLKE